MTETTHPRRVFTDDAEPPFGERITMTNLAGDILTWTGKRWHWNISADLQLHDAWPPNVEGPYTEVVCECFVTPEERWTRHYDSTEPGSMLEPNPECPVHFPTEVPRG